MKHIHNPAAWPDAVIPKKGGAIMRFFHSFPFVIMMVTGGCTNPAANFNSLVKAEDTGHITDDTGTPPELPTWCFDGDLDGFGDPADSQQSELQPNHYVADCGDCDDTNAAINPKASETCNEIDDNCDGTIDEGVTSEFYADEDSDNYGDALDTTQACTAPDGYVSDNTDCDDAESDIFPGNLEVCDGLDNDCDDVIDDAAADATTWYPDLDSDGFGDGTSSGPVTSCEAPTGYVADAADCDDSDDLANPSATEYCDSFDNNCDGVIDEATASGVTTWFADTDADGFGNAAVMVVQCYEPLGYVTDATDCDDTNTAVNPDATEVCNGIDDDCNGSIDGSDATDVATWYRDADSDGFGDLANTFVSCASPDGYTNDATDCDDTNSGAYPGATEYCDGADNNCDGTVDENSAADVATWFQDADNDGFGGSTSLTTCGKPSGYVENGGDCRDTNDSFYPGAAEFCDDPNDYNCDGFVGYEDNDGDGFAACEECDDSDPDVFPAATEFCNEQDDDCDGVIDDGAVDATTWYADTDDDGYGNSALTFISCEAPVGYVSDATDCDDIHATVYPDHSEYCDGLDNDCDGTIDEDDALDAQTRYADNDGDGYGGSTSLTTCGKPSGYVENSSDCDDLNSNVHPDATEYCDGADNDCNGLVDDSVVTATWYVDADLDGYGDSATAFTSCSIVSGYVLVNGDCNDTDAAINPAAEDVCEDGIDQDCDDSDAECPVVPEGPAVDEDADGYSTLSDCDDTNAAVHPGATEVCGDGIDNDCSGGDFDCNDVDWDGDGLSVNAGDCDDTDAAIYPGAGESCVNGVDDDCDGKIDTLDEDCGDMVDDDGDGYAGADCDDTNPAINPGATEIPYNGIDEDCDGADLTDADGDGYDYDTDCDETNLDIHPGAEEVCGNGVDEDCDGNDLGCVPPPEGPYLDVDGDGYSWPDCDDTNAAVHPGAAEIANDVDDDCDGVVDEGTDIYDDDGDGYSEAGGDCDDTNPDVNPDEIERCDGFDNDCDGSVDEAAAWGSSMWYVDLDSDGYGDPMAGAFSCDEPVGYTADNTDCDDTSAAAFPGNPEVCDDGLDNDCDGDVDLNDEACAASVDGDGDGYAASIDCNDTNAAVHPGATEIANGVDDDCDGVVDEGTDVYDDDGDGYSETDGDCDDTDPDLLWYEAGWIDADTDGHGHEGFADKWLCGSEVGYATNSDDCNDLDASVNPGATDICEDGVDQDCDGSDAVCPPEDTGSSDTGL